MMASRLGVRRAGIIGTGLLAIAGFAIGGWQDLPGLAALGGLAACVAVLIGARIWVWALPVASLALLVPTTTGWQAYDPIAGIVILLGSLAIPVRNQEEDWRFTASDLLAVAFLLVPLLGLWDVTSGQSFLGKYKEVVIYCGLFLVLSRIVSKSDRDVLLWSFPILGSAIALQLMRKVSGSEVFLLQRISFRNFYTDLGWGRSNYIAAVLMLCMFGTLLLMARRKSLPVRSLGVAALLVMAQVFLLTLSRGGSVCLVLGLTVALLLWNWKVAVAGLALVPIGFVGLIGTLAGQGLLSRFIDPVEYASWISRTLYWQIAWERFLAHPWTGIGLNQGRYQGDLLAIESPHNLILNQLMEQGVLGGCVILLVLGSIVVACWRLSGGSTGETETRGVRALSCGLVAAVGLHAMVDPTIPDHVISVPFVFFLVWLRLSLKERESSRVPRIPSAHKLVDGLPSSTT